MGSEAKVFKIKELVEQLVPLNPSLLDADFNVWRKKAERVLIEIFGKESIQYKQFMDISFFYDQDRDKKLAGDFLKQLVNEIPDEIHQEKVDASIDPTKVFIVHGHDDAARDKVARFLTKLKLTPIILNEQANKGMTIIEKFEHYSNVGFAIALLTKDDLGNSKIEINKKSDEKNRININEDLNPRSRQNVIFELGFFFGKLQRKNAVALLESGVEKPSDVDGIVYIPFSDTSGWETLLIREMKSANLQIDANDMF